MTVRVLTGTPASLSRPVVQYGISQIAAELQQQLAAAQTRVREPISNREPNLKERFAKLARQWEEDTGHLSSINQIVMHPAYQRIIGMGPAVVPLLLDDLVRTRSHWFWALSAITGENPIPRDARGHVDRMVTAWAEWGRANGWL